MKMLKFLCAVFAVSVGKLAVSFAAALAIVCLACAIRAWVTDWAFAFGSALRLTAFAWLAFFDWTVVRGNRPLEYGERRMRERVFYWVAWLTLAWLAFSAYRFYFRGAGFDAALMKWNIGFAVFVVMFGFGETVLRFVVMPAFVGGQHEMLRRVMRMAVSVVRWAGAILLPIPLAIAVMCALAFILAPLTAVGHWMFVSLKCLLGFGAGVAVPMLTYWIAPSRKFNAASIMAAFEAGYLLASFVNQRAYQLVSGTIPMGEIVELSIHFCGLIIGVFLAIRASKRHL